MKDYVNYLSQVLGLESVMLSAPRRALETAANFSSPHFFYTASGAVDSQFEFQKKDLVIVNWVREPHESLFEPEVAELFSKMLPAMKMPAEKVLVFDCVMNDRNLIPNELFKVCDPKFVLFFSGEPQHLSEIQLKGPANWLETLSPVYLLKNPDSKKLVWNDMQKIMKELKKWNS